MTQVLQLCQPLYLLVDLNTMPTANPHPHTWKNCLYWSLKKAGAWRCSTAASSDTLLVAWLKPPGALTPADPSSWSLR